MKKLELDKDFALVSVFSLMVMEMIAHGHRELAYWGVGLSLVMMAAIQAFNTLFAEGDN